MTDRQRRIFDTDLETIDIPDFVEEKNNTDSSSVDMSIFKMSDEDLYDDDEDYDDDDDYELRPRRKKNVALIIALITIFILLAALFGAMFYAIRQHQAYVSANTELQQLKANEENYRAQLSEKDTTIAALTQQVEELTKTKQEATAQAGTYEVVDGPLSFRDEPIHTDPGFISYKGVEAMDNGEKFTALEVVKGTDDPDYLYAKLADGVYVCLGTADDVWAKKVD